MRAFRNGGDHVRSMRYLLHWCDEASYVHFDQPDADIPSADVLFQQLRDQGTLSKVLKPSPAQVAGELAGKTVPRVANRITPKRRTDEHGE